MGLSRVPSLALVVAALVAGEADAQRLPRVPLALEARLGGALPTGDFSSRDSGIGAEPGLAVSIGAALDLPLGLAAYASYRHERFGCGECRDLSLHRTAVSRGLEAGGQALIPSTPFGLRPWLRGGVLRQSLELGDEGGEVRSRPGVGFVVGGGVQVARGSLILSPAIHFRSYPADFELSGLLLQAEDGAGVARATDVTHLSVDLGLVFRF